MTPADEAEQEQPVLTAAMISREFRRLRWPSAELTLQPPGARTLVNLPTVFSTDLVEPRTQTVTLLGVQVRIEATPVGYRWRPGDGISWVTDEPGAPYTAGADIALLNTHVYAAAGRVRPSVDVTYHGRYQVAGGPWTDIPQELTVGGAGVALTVLEAKANLAG